MMLKNVPSVHSYSKKKELHPAWIEIDLHQFGLNIQSIKSHIGEVLYCLPIKANAYGHGLKEIGLAAQAAGVHYLGVSNVFEGIQLRECGVEIPILVFGAFQKEQLEAFLNYDLEFTISSFYKAKLAHEFLSKTQQTGKVHLEIDTGMNRTGARVKTSESIYSYIKQSPYLNLVGIYSHFANSEDKNEILNRSQHAQFLDTVRFCGENYIYHLANSGAVVHLPSSYYQMVRPGLLSYGIYSKPLKGCLDALQSCFTLKSRVSYFKVVEKNQGIGYGPTHKTNQQTRVATISIGYGDGYRRCLSNKGDVLIRGKRFPIVGSICMDQLMVDLGDQEAYVGDEVVLIGKQEQEEISVHEVSNHLNTIPYEVLSGFTDRVPRFYI